MTRPSTGGTAGDSTMVTLRMLARVAQSPCPRRDLRQNVDICAYGHICGDDSSRKSPVHSGPPPAPNSGAYRRLAASTRSTARASGPRVEPRHAPKQRQAAVRRAGTRFAWGATKTPPMCLLRRINPAAGTQLDRPALPRTRCAEPPSSSSPAPAAARPRSRRRLPMPAPTPGARSCPPRPGDTPRRGNPRRSPPSTSACSPRSEPAGTRSRPCPSAGASAPPSARWPPKRTRWSPTSTARPSTRSCTSRGSR